MIPLTLASVRASLREGDSVTLGGVRYRVERTLDGLRAVPEKPRKPKAPAAPAEPAPEEA